MVKAEKSKKVSDVNFAVLCAKVDNIQADVKEIKHTLESNYITKDQFQPVKMIVYGMVSLLLTAMVVAIISQVLK